MMTAEPESRGVYYYACYRFVKYLVDMAGMEVFGSLMKTCGARAGSGSTIC